jgi:hypothetical protein
MDQINQPKEIGIYIIHLELNETQNNNWRSSIWTPVPRPTIDLSVPNGCILSWSTRLPDKKKLLQCQSFGFCGGLISIGSIHKLSNTNLWVLTNKYKIDECWLEFFWQQFPQTHIIEPEWWGFCYNQIQEQPPSKIDWLFGIDGVFETNDFSSFNQQFLKLDQSSCTNISKPVLKVSYVDWQPGVEQPLPGSLSWFTGLSLPLHLSKKG